MAEVAETPDDAERQRSVMLTERGDALVTQGNLAEALQTYQNCLAITERLTKANSAMWSGSTITPSPTKGLAACWRGKVISLRQRKSIQTATRRGSVWARSVPYRQPGLQPRNAAYLEALNVETKSLPDIVRHHSPLR